MASYTGYAVAYYAGYSLGIVEYDPTANLPKDLQVDGFAGVNGVAVKDLGSRGKRTRVRCLLWGDSPADLGGIELVFMNLQAAGGAYPYVDTKGRIWPNVLLIDFTPVPPGRWWAGLGFGQVYELDLFHTD